MGGRTGRVWSTENVCEVSAPRKFSQIRGDDELSTAPYVNIYIFKYLRDQISHMGCVTPSHDDFGAMRARPCGLEVSGGCTRCRG
jgi:hypothetical protein